MHKCTCEGIQATQAKGKGRGHKNGRLYAISMRQGGDLVGKAVNIRNVPDEAAQKFSELSEQAKEKLGIKQGQLFSEGVRLLVQKMGRMITF